jgi:EpsI family protein
MSLRSRLGISVALLLVAFFALHFRSASEGVPLRKSFDRFPDAIGSWSARDDNVLDTRTLGMLRMSDYLFRRYVDGTGRSAWLYIGYWESQRRGTDIHSPKNCLPGGGWEPVETSRISIPVTGAAAPITVNRFLIQKDRQMQVVIYWFQAQGTVVPGELDAKIAMVRSAIFRNRTDGALVRISSLVHGSIPETTEALVAYIQDLYPVLRDYLPE